MKLLLALVISLLLLVSAPLALAHDASAPSFPWQRYSDIPKDEMSGGPACDGTAVSVNINAEWKTLSTPSRDIFLHFGGDGHPDWVYLTEGIAGGVITVKRVLPFDEAKEKIPDPCAYLNAANA